MRCDFNAWAVRRLQICIHITRIHISQRSAILSAPTLFEPISRSLSLSLCGVLRSSKLPTLCDFVAKCACTHLRDITIFYCYRFAVGKQQTVHASASTANSAHKTHANVCEKKTKENKLKRCRVRTRLSAERSRGGEHAADIQRPAGRCINICVFLRSTRFVFLRLYNISSHNYTHSAA